MSLHVPICVPVLKSVSSILSSNRLTPSSVTVDSPTNNSLTKLMVKQFAY